MDINSFLWSLDAFSLINTESQKNNLNKTPIDFFSNPGSKFVRQNSSKNFNLPSKQQHSSTPAIQKLCKCLEEDLNRLLNDIEISTTGTFLQNNDLNISILNDDFKYFNEYLQDNLHLFSESLFKSFTELIESLNVDNKSSDTTTEFGFSLSIKKILLICRLAHALPYNCPHLKICFNNLNQQLIQQRQQLLSNSKSSENSANSIISSIAKKKAALQETKVN